MFHKSRLGAFGADLPCDLEGFVPEEGDEPASFRWEGDDFAQDFDDNGDGYDGYAAEAWSDFVSLAVEATAKAKAALEQWQSEES